ncbi:MAG TPA: hypothetical protein VFV33_01240, partial [Gemmatimonadaceae bacterium]|nr:hypothetical protein [Gemmatimonadaceae bacterium]
PLQLGREWHCPDLAGRYAFAPEPVSHLLAGRFAPWDSVPRELESFTIAGSADTALHVTLGYLDGGTVEKRLVKGSEYAGDYHCGDGWLHLLSRDIPDRWDAEVKSGDFFAKRRAMRIAVGADGRLVGRLDRIDYDEFAVWCGDGCQGIALPWTFETRSTWSAAQRWEEGAPRPSVVAQEQAEARQAAERARLQQDPLYRENEALENGPPVAGQAEARQRVMAAVVPGMLVRAVAPRDSGWHLSLEYESNPQLVEFMERLSQSGPVAEIRHESLYRGRMPSGRWTTVVYVRYEP